MSRRVAFRLAVVACGIIAQTASGQFFYWTDIDRISKANLDGTGQLDLATGLTASGGVTLNLPESMVYWTDLVNGTIRRMTLTGANVQTVRAGLVSPIDLAIDTGAAMVYWTESGRIARAPLSGGSITPLVMSVTSPSGIALDIPGGKMYWTDLVTGLIQRSNLNGTGVETLLSSLPSPAGIALDTAAGHMYWTESSRVRRASLNGSGAVTLVSGLGQPFGISLDLVNDRIYWADPQQDSVKSSDLDGSNVLTVVAGLDSPQDVAVDAGCGNGIVTLGTEQCDDGNFSSNDGCSPTCTREPLLFVDADADGSTLSGWCGAHLTLDAALDVSQPGDVIRIANGTYLPDTAGLADVRKATFTLANLTLLGGYAGCGAANPNLRDFSGQSTVLSGDIGLPASTTDNVYHVVTVTTGTALIEGVAITAGNATGASPDNAGAGLRHTGGTANLKNTLIINNSAAGTGGGISTTGGTLNVVNSMVLGNTATNSGGGVYVAGAATAALTNVAFSGNDSLVANGAGLRLTGTGTITATNLTLTANVAAIAGGGISNAGANLQLSNAIVYGNSDGSGSGEAAQVSTTSGTTSVNYSLIAGLTGGLGGTGNIAGDPLFFNAAGVDGLAGTVDDDLVLLPGSPAIDAANGAVVPADILDADGDGNLTEQVPLDANRVARFSDNPATADTGVAGISDPDVPDMGAYEVQECSTVEQCCDLDSNTIRDDNCVWCECAGACTTIDISAVFADMGGAFGVCPADTFANVHDRNHALTCFSSLNPCPSLNIDAGGAFGACVPDGFCNIHDANHALTSFAGSNTCSCGAAPEFIAAPPVVGKAAVELIGSDRTATPGQRVHVRVFIETGATLQSYQLHLGVFGGDRGSLTLEDIQVEARGDHVFAGRDPFGAVNIETAQMLRGLDGDSVALRGQRYLATFVYRLSDDASGSFVIDLLHDAELGDQTYFISEFINAVEVSRVEPVTVTVNQPELRRRTRR